MACPSCGTENPAGARFCMSCGTALERRCPNCGSPAPPEARFCMTCGHALDGATPAPASPAPAAGAPQTLPEERRQVTVLFADLSGYTAFAERMDPEAVKALVDRALARLGQEVARYGGTVDKYIGDNVMAIFGAPVAHEDDAERAVRAGLGMQDAMDEVNEGLPGGAHFELRVGVNTGEVLAGAVGEAYTVIGDTVNVAARLQDRATAGQILIGEATFTEVQAAVGDLLVHRALKDVVLKGREQPLAVHEVIRIMTPSA
jgi:class 3 adenylate cyclase